MDIVIHEFSIIARMFLSDIMNMLIYWWKNHIYWEISFHQELINLLLCLLFIITYLNYIGIQSIWLLWAQCLAVFTREDIWHGRLQFVKKKKRKTSHSLVLVVCHHVSNHVEEGRHCLQPNNVVIDNLETLNSKEILIARNEARNQSCYLSIIQNLLKHLYTSHGSLKRSTLQIKETKIRTR